MNSKILALLASFLLAASGPFSPASANPFSPQIEKSKPAVKKKKTAKALLYKGYALTSEEKVAFVERAGREYIVQKGDKIQNLKIIDIRDEYILYRLNGKIRRASIEGGDK